MAIRQSTAASTATRGHIAIDPGSEIVTATGVTPGNSGDAEAAGGLIADLLPGDQGSAGMQPGGQETDVVPAVPGTAGGGSGQAAVYGDAAYGSGELAERVEDAASAPASRCSRRPR